MSSDWYELDGRLIRLAPDMDLPGCHVINELTGTMSWDPRVDVGEALLSGRRVRPLSDRQKQAMMRRIRQTAGLRWQEALDAAATVEDLDALAERLPYESAEWRSTEIPEMREQVIARYRALRVRDDARSVRACPECGSRRVIPIRYGFPTEETDAAAVRGEVKLGGCCVWGDVSEMPAWWCRTCRCEW